MKMNAALQQSFSIIGIVIVTSFCRIDFSQAVAKERLKDFGFEIFSQSVDSDLLIREVDPARELNIKPEPPSFFGFGVKYKGLGLSLQTATGDNETRSDGFATKWSVPWKRHFIEAYFISYDGAFVGENKFRSDIDVVSGGVTVTRALNEEFNFSSIVGLDRELHAETFKSVSTKYWAATLSYHRWRGNRPLAEDIVTGPSDDLGFNEIRRTLLSIRYGGAYAAYWPWGRVGIMGDIGALGGRRQSRYSDRETEATEKIGLSVSIMLSLTSAAGLKEFDKRNDIQSGYGLRVRSLSHNGVNNENVDTSLNEGTIFYGVLF